MNPNAYEILIVDDEADIRMQIAGILEDEGYSTREAGSGEAALEAVAARLPSLVILDVWLAGSAYDGLQVLEILKRDHPALQVIMISGHGTFDMAVNATKTGAYDFISKPFKTDVLLHTVSRALQDVKIRRENEALRSMTGNKEAELVGRSPAIQEIRRVMEKVVGTDSRILFTGPPGAGKSSLARLFHAKSKRSDGPFVVMNCASLQDDRFETTLFGKEPEGESPRITGVLEQAHMGTLLLDEVADMPADVQGKIVRVLHSQKFQRVGGGPWVEVDVRVFATTNKNLLLAMEEGSFREDLYYRLNVVPVTLPPLADRREDMAELADAIMAKAASVNGRSVRSLTPEAISAMQAHDWPGNVWELANVVERLLLLAPADSRQPVSAESVLRAIGEQENKSFSWERAQDVMNQPLRDAREAFEREYLMFHLLRFGRNISRTAEFVGMDRAALHRKLKGLGLQNDLRNAKDSA